MDLYFDSSSLVKYFQEEKGSRKVNNLIKSQSNEIYISELSKLEIMSSVYRKCRYNEIDNDDLTDIIESMERIIEEFHIEPINSTVINETKDILKNIGGDILIRSLDAIHLATFQLISDENYKFVSNDNTQTAAAEILGFSTIRPK